MNVTLIKPYGFCNGVKRAFSIVEKAIIENPNKKIYIIGSLIHNKLANDSLIRKNITIFESDEEKEQITYIESLKSNIIIIFPAHGHYKNVELLLNSKGIKFYDTICPLLLKNLRIIKEKPNAFYFYIGDKNHMECKSIISYMKNNHYQIIDKNNNDVTIIDGVEEEIIVISQSTCLGENTNRIKNLILSKYPKTNVNINLCNVVIEREKNLLKNLRTNHFSKTIIVGDGSSANTTNLLKLYYNYTKTKNNCFFILNSNEIEKTYFNEDDNILITSGTSAPTEIVEKIYKDLKKL